MAIGGLIDRREIIGITKIPLLSSIPVFGTLFRSRSFQRNESELVIFIKVKTTGESIPQPYQPFILPGPSSLTAPGGAGGAGGAAAPAGAGGGGGAAPGSSGGGS